MWIVPFEENIQAVRDYKKNNISNVRIKIVILSIMLFGMCCACSEKSHFDEPRPEITVVLGLSGAGDNGYNDEILAGIMDVNETNEVSLSMISPTSMDDARSALSTWVNKDFSGVHALLVLAGNEYESLIQDITLPQNKSILIFESEDDNLPNRVSSFYDTSIWRFIFSRLHGKRSGIGKCYSCDAIGILFGRCGKWFCGWLFYWWQ